MDRLTFPKDAFLMSFLLRQSFALHLHTPNYRRVGNSSSASSSSNNSSDDTRESNELQQNSSQGQTTEQPWESTVSELQDYFIDACKTCEASLDAKIGFLPKIRITQEHVDKVELCSVCMENFTIDEEAKCLPCSHLFHDQCVSPWLKKRQTCPICRKVAVTARNDRSRSRLYRFQPFRRFPSAGVRVFGPFCRLNHNHATPE